MKQEQAADLKAEVRGLLAEHGIDKYVIKPVRRNYAFELETVPHGEQWVLKVRYSAAKPSLPLGLEGALLCRLIFQYANAASLYTQHRYACCSSQSGRVPCLASVRHCMLKCEGVAWQPPGAAELHRLIRQLHAV